MSKFLTKYNSDDVFFRAIIVGVLNFMTNKVQLWNVIDGEVEEFPVPFYYNAGGDQRFMQDIFQQQSLDDCINEKVTEANSDIIPRGHITLTNISVIASSLSNRFIRGEWTKETKDEIITYNSPMNIIPLELTFECEIKIDTKLMAFKLAQRLIQTFYKAYAFEFMWEGMALKAGIAFPEDNTVENVYEFTFGDNTDSKINFQVVVETYLPVIDKTQTFAKSNRIENFELNDSVGNIFWPDKGLDGENVTRTPIPNIDANFTTTNNVVIPDVVSDASRVVWWDSLTKDKKEKVTEDNGKEIQGKPTEPGEIPIYSLRDKMDKKS